MRQGLQLAKILSLAMLLAGLAQARHTVAIECEDFQYPGSWSESGSGRGASNGNAIFAGQAAKLPAVTAVTIPQAGRYTLWMRTLDFPIDRPGFRTFNVQVGAKRSNQAFGKTGKPNFNWEKGEVFDLPTGPVLLALHDSANHFGRADALLLTDDPTFVPSTAVGTTEIPQSKPLLIDEAAGGQAVTISPVSLSGQAPAPIAEIKNEQLDIRFVATQRAGKASISPQVQVKGTGNWQSAPIDMAAESYQVLACPINSKLDFRAFYPSWSPLQHDSANVEVAGVKIQTATAKGSAVWNAGQGYEAIARTATQESPTRVRLDFHPTPAGTLQAWWELKSGEHTARVELVFTPQQAGQIALGYYAFARKPLADVQQLMLPMMFHGRRFPAKPFTMPNGMAPTPLALMQYGPAAAPFTLALVGDPAEIPFEFPDPFKSRFGMMIRNEAGQVQPSIYGPLPGTPYAMAQAGKPVRFKFRVVAQQGTWYGAFRTAADEVFALRDYRRAGEVSLTDAALNMIDLFKDDFHGGWWVRGKGEYQIETKNGVTQASPLTAVELYRLTGDLDLYQRRTVPTLEFMLSRSSQHFSPVPNDTGHYDAGSMEGPVQLYGTTTYAGLYESTNHRMPILQRIGLPVGDVKPTKGYTHGQGYEEWLARYLYTGDKAALEKTKKLADEYIKKAIDTPPSGELGPNPFFLIEYTPAWEGLLRLYEVTQERRYLEAAARGAQIVMTGMWTQPVPPARDVTINPGGKSTGDVMGVQFWKGSERYRLGFPLKPDATPEHKAPAWLVSSVGLGFEQPVTYVRKNNGGRQIMQAPWAPAFLRLAEYTGDKTFEMYARNATVGRWGNYPGYYITTLTDQFQHANYPTVGPDLSCIYFHHIMPHLSWTIDYLVSEAQLLSKGMIKFPALRQYGYAYFDNLVYGHAPGEIYGDKGAWLWLRKGLVTLDNPQINYLPAHTADRFYLILTNQNQQPETVHITFQRDRITSNGTQLTQAHLRLANGQSREVTLTNNVAEVQLGARELAVLTIDGLQIDVPAHRQYPEPAKAAQPDFITAKSSNGVEVRAAAIQVEPGPWQAFVWSTAGTNDLKNVRLTWNAGAKSGTQEVGEYPFEFSVPLATGQTSCRFKVEGTKADGTPFSIAEQTLGVAE
jgi:hypothetical protein